MQTRNLTALWLFLSSAFIASFVTLMAAHVVQAQAQAQAQVDDGTFPPSAASSSSLKETPPDALAALEARPWRIYGGAAGGYGNVSGSNYTKASDGPSALLDADLSYQIPRWVVEAGAGWMYSRLDGAVGNPVSVRTRTGFADASVRYRLSRHLQLGPAFNYDFGTDATFAPSVGNTQNLSLLGLRADYELALSRSIPFRIVLQGLTSLESGYHYVLVTAGFQVGLPFGGRGAPPSGEQKPIITSSAAPVAADRPNDVRISLDPEKVFFRTNSSGIRPEVAGILQEIGQYLSHHEDAWGSLEVSGHADQRGRAGYNLKLSQRRSESVRSLLTQSGVSEDKVALRFFGFGRPVDPRNNVRAWAKNRRVELVFHDVYDPKELAAKIAQLSKYQLAEDDS